MRPDPPIWSRHERSAVAFWPQRKALLWPNPGQGFFGLAPKP